MKTCTKCNIEQSLDEFSWKNKTNGTRHSWCKTCFRVKLRSHYNENKEQYFARNKKHEIRAKAYIRDLRAAPCHDCQLVYPWYVMEFDHREPDLKVHNIARMPHRSWTQIETEVAKCDVVCANCHRARTHIRRQAHVGE